MTTGADATTCVTTRADATTCVTTGADATTCVTTGADATTCVTTRVGILLSTYNGARFLPAQLDSFSQQTEPGWVLFWRDDGSTDETVALMQDFAAGRGDQVRRVDAPGHLGASESFFALLRAAAGQSLPLAFADQDDVWFAQKLAWAVEALEHATGPVLYCSRQILADEALRPIRPSAPLPRAPGFPAALTQNIATGCTTMLDPHAVALVARSRPPAGTLHDWWAYLLVTAAGGRVIADDRPTLHYRQHGSNLVGAPSTRWHRARAALQRGPAAYMRLLRTHVAALLEQSELFTPQSRATLTQLDAALRAGPLARLGALRLAGLERQTALETALFRCWFLIG